MADWSSILEQQPTRGLLLLTIVLGALALVTWILYRRTGRITPSDALMPFFEHAQELRGRLLRVGGLVLLWTVLFLTVRVEPFQIGGLRLGYPAPQVFDNIAAQVYHWLVATTVPPNVTVIVTTPMEAVGAQMGIALLLAFIICAPAILYETWAFFAPGLASRERRFLLNSAPAALLLFLAGAAFGLWVVVPLMFRVLYGFAEPLGATAFLSAGSLIGYVLALVATFGIAFELPLVMVALVRVGWTTPAAYVAKWRHATIAIFIAAAVASDPTLASQLLIASLLLLLYWGGVAVSYWARPPVPIVRPNRTSKA